jgi:hypothetical protein
MGHSAAFPAVGGAMPYEHIPYEVENRDSDLLLIEPAK